jgi:hypothetical protein
MVRSTTQRTLGSWGGAAVRMMAPSGQRQSKGPFGHTVMVTPVAQDRFASDTTTGIVACALVLVTLPVTFPGCFTVSPLLMLPHNADALIDPRHGCPIRPPVP